MAWSRAQSSSSFISGSTIYAYTEVDWYVEATKCPYRQIGGVNSPYGGWSTNPSATLYWREWNGSSWGSWVEYASDSAHYTGPGDLGVVDVSDYFSRYATDRSIELDVDVYASSSTGSGTGYAKLAYTVPHLASAPTNLKATRNSDTSITISWTNPSTSYDNIYIYASRNGGGYSLIRTQGSSTSYTWTSAQADSVYVFRAYTSYQGSSSGYSNTATAYTTPTAPTWTSVTRNSNNKVTLTWSNSSASYTKVYIQRQTDGGSWSALANVNSGTTSYADTTTTADHAYKYRIASYNGMYSSYVTSGTTITMTPAAPTSISLARTGSGTDVAVTLANTSNVATSVEWEWSSNGTSWNTGGTVVGSPVTSFTVTTIQGTGYVRARNKNATGTSSWIVSEAVTTLTPPLAPTLRAPIGIVNMTALNVVFEWQHNPVDGSAQTAYELKYARNGGSYTTLTGTTAQTRSVAMTTFSAGDEVTWQVRTKGADANYGEWSTETFYTYSEPGVNITAPTGNVTAMPIPMTATYTDMTGYTCEAATVSLLLGGRELFSEAATISGGSITASLDASEFLPENGTEYTVRVVARSSSSLQATANGTFTTAFVEPVPGSLSVANEPDTGYVVLTVSYDNSSLGDYVAAQSVSVARVNADGTTTMLIDRGGNGAGVTDMYAPLNTPYQYAVITHAASEAINTVYVDNIISATEWFAYWGGNIAKGKWNPDNGGIGMNRPQKKRVYYAGRRDPVSYDGSAVAFSESPSWFFLEQEQVAPFMQLMEDGGRGVYKSCDGMVYHADFELTIRPEYTAAGYYGSAAVNVTRIAGRQL